MIAQTGSAAIGDAVAISRSVEIPQAFEVIFDRHFDAVHRYLARRAGRQCADDLTSQTFVVAFERRTSFRREASDARLMHGDLGARNREPIEVDRQLGERAQGIEHRRDQDYRNRAEDNAHRDEHPQKPHETAVTDRGAKAPIAVGAPHVLQGSRTAPIDM